jgi:hypothetical protein
MNPSRIRGSTAYCSLIRVPIEKPVAVWVFEISGAVPPAHVVGGMPEP